MRDCDEGGGSSTHRDLLEMHFATSGNELDH